MNFFFIVFYISLIFCRSNKPTIHRGDNSGGSKKKVVYTTTGCDQTVVTDAINKLNGLISDAQAVLEDLKKLQQGSILWDNTVGENIPGLVISKDRRLAQRDYNHPSETFMTSHTLPAISSGEKTSLTLRYNGSCNVEDCESWFGICPADTDFLVDSGVMGDSENSYSFALGSGNKRNNLDYETYCSETVVKSGDTIQAIIENEAISYTVNGVDCGIAFKNIGPGPYVFGVDIFRDGNQSFFILED